MSSQTSLLLYGRDPHLLKTRQWVLERAGYRIVTATKLCEIGQFVSLQQIDLLLLCHTLSVEECGRALALAHTQWPQIESIVLIAGQNGRQRDPSHEIPEEVVDAMEGPGKLLNVVARLVSSEAAMHLTPHKPL